MPRLADKHKELLTLYGEGNEKRLTGHHDTSSMNTFSYKSRNRGSSVRIPVITE
jgi:glutamine synthetase